MIVKKGVPDSDNRELPLILVRMFLTGESLESAQ